MGVQDRDYMRRHGPEPGAGDARNQADSPRRGWPTQLGLWIVGALLLIFAVKYFMERRDAVPFPSTGDVHWYSAETQPRIARLTLRAPTIGSKKFAVRLSDWATGAPLAMIPVRSGETSVTLVPLGRYRMTISQGTVWMGSARMFGLNGEHREVVDPVEFYQRANQTFGVQVNLEVPFSGNMSTQPILRP